MGIDDSGAPSSALERLFGPAVDDGGRPTTQAVGAKVTPWVLDLILRDRAAGPSMRVCSHLAEHPDQGSVWRASIPDVRSCRRPACTAAVLALLEERLGHPVEHDPPRCTSCGRTGVTIRGVGVQVGAAMLRGTVCDDCFAAEPIPTPASASATGPAASATEGARRLLLELDAEPLVADPQEPADAGSRLDLDAVGRRALRRGRLLAEACAKTTGTGLDPERAVVGGLLVRAAKLAGGLAAPATADGAFVHDLAFRSLVETTTTLWWLLRLGDAAAATATAAFREPRSTERGPAELRDRLAALDREADLALLLGPSPDVVPGSWQELTTLHLTDRPDGFALDLGTRAVDPMRALIAGEHLSLACADYVDSVPTDLDAGEVRRLADEVTELRARVEAASAGVSTKSDDD